MKENIINNTAEKTSINNVENTPISVKEWVVTILLLVIPIVNIIMLFLWAFGKETSATKSNFAKAYLLWILIGTVVAIFFILLLIPFGLVLTS
jgi:succinate dehydrogenase/fumarate reductase cytochrome b subunit